MSFLNKVTNAGQRRAGWQRLIAVAVVTAYVAAAILLPTMGPPGLGIAVIAAMTSFAIIVLAQYDTEKTVGPAAWKLHLIALTMVAGVGYATLNASLVLSHGTTLPARLILIGLLVAAVSTIAATAWRQLRDTNPTVWPVTVGDAVDVATDDGWLKTALLGSALITAIGALAVRQIPLAPLAVVVTLLIPVVIGRKTAQARGSMRVLVSRKYCAAFTGDEWTQVLRAAKQSPVTCVWTTTSSWPDQILVPTPMGYDGANLENDKRRLLTMLTNDGSVHGDYRVRADLHNNRLIVETGLPKLAPYPGYQGRPWYEIPIGPSEDGGVAVVNVLENPHTLVAGNTGAGKSVLQRAMLAHFLMHRAKWRIIGVDMKKVELNWLEKFPNALRIATELEDAVDAVRNVRDEMSRRYDQMHDEGVNHFEMLAQPVPATLLLVDETYAFLAFEKSKTEEGKIRDELRSEARFLLGEIARLGRAAGIFQILSTQRPDADVLAGETKANLDNRIAAGRMDATPSGMVLDSGAAQQLPRIKGRGIIRHGGELERFQGYFIELGPDLDRMIEEGVKAIAAGNTVHAPTATVVHAPTVAPAAPAVPVGATPVTDRDKVAGPAVTDPTVKFVDVGGYDDVKAQLMDAVGTLINNPNAAAKYRITPSGVLLFGPPGTGKTLLAEATAGEFGLKFCKVTTGNLTSKFVSEGPERVIAMADAVVAATPCLLFIDEFDGIAPRRGGGAHHEDDKVLLELLRQMDRLRLVPGVVVMAATNRFEALDPAAIRDGRMGTQIRVDLPDGDAREAILHAALARRPLEPDMDVASIVEATDGATGATLAGIVTVAATVALKADRLITTQDLLDAIKSRGGKDRPTVESAGLDQLILDPQSRATINQLLSLLTNPAQAKALGMKLPTGAILYGPPGTGKTSLARAIAAEAGYSFYPCKGSDFMSAYAGKGDRAVEELFQRARANKPSIIFIDEIDGLATNRDNMPPWQAATVTTLLTLLDGFESNAGVFTIAATNRFEALDPGLVRGGRLSEHIEIGLPDKAGREALLALFTRTMPVADDVDLAAFAHMLEGFSPSDIEGAVQKAAMAALSRANTAGVPVGTVTAADFADALGIWPPDVTRTATAPPVVEDDVIVGEIVDDVPDADIVDDAWAIDFVDDLLAKDAEGIQA